MVQIEEDTKKAHRIGIIGGTFDPIHYGHLVAAQWAKETFLLDKILFIPAGSPPHKNNKSVLVAEHRFTMTILATVDNPFFQVSSLEIKREGTSYTIDTINELRTLYGEDVQLYFITGADSILEIHTWKRYEELLNSCYFIAATRVGYDTDELHKRIEEIYSLYGNKISILEIPAVGISSTELRRRIRAGKSVKYLVPPSVEEYIFKNKLYRTQGE